VADLVDRDNSDLHSLLKSTNARVLAVSRDLRPDLAARALTVGRLGGWRRRRKRQVAAGTAAGAASDPKLSSKAGMSSTGRATGSSGLCHLSDDAAAAALATVPTKPGGSTPASLESLLQGWRRWRAEGWPTARALRTLTCCLMSPAW